MIDNMIKWLSKSDIRTFGAVLFLYALIFMIGVVMGVELSIIIEGTTFE